MIGRGLIKTALTILLMEIAAGTAGAQSGRSWMNGIVLDESDTNGIAVATVELIGAPESARLRSVRLTTQTDSNGKYSFKDVPYGDWIRFAYRRQGSPLIRSSFTSPRMH